ncbi:MAG: AtpZ/AtpI family protein [Planctomycetota bacterium]
MSVPLPQRQSDQERERTGLLRYASMGFELAATIVGLTLMGVWFDYHFKTSPTGVLIGAALGVTGGLYNFIRAALRLTTERGGPPPPNREKRSDDDLTGQ